MTEIKLDQTTLPQNGQHVKWITLENDINGGEWKEGVYSNEDEYETFYHGPDPNEDYDFAWDVVRWEPL